MIKIKGSGVWAKVKLNNKKEFLWLSTILKKQVIVQTFPNLIINEYEMLDKKSKRFPLGLLGYVIRKAKKDDIDLVIDNSVYTYENCKLSSKFDFLYVYQKEAIYRAYKKRRGIIKAPTGSGKTLMLFGLASLIKGKILLCVKSIDILNQLVKEYNEFFNITAGVIQGSKIDIRQFTIASLDTLHSKKDDKFLNEYLSKVACLIVDECHSLGSPTYYNVAMNVKNAKWRIGFSATPFGRSDSLDFKVVAALGGTIKKISIQELAFCKNPTIARPYITFFSSNADVIEYPANPWFKCYENIIVVCDCRNKNIVDLCHYLPKPILINFYSKKHGKILFSLFENTNLKTAMLSGDDTSFIRNSVKDSLNNREYDVLLASKIFDTGVDIPNVKTCINVAGMQATIPLIQKLGRGMRKKKSNFFIFIDFYDDHHEVCLRHSKQRIKVYEKEGLEVLQTSNIKSIYEWIKKEEKKYAKKRSYQNYCKNKYAKSKKKRS